MREAIVVFPVPANLIDRLFHGGKDVFVKYLPRASSLKLRPGARIIFYASHGKKEIVGEGAVDTMEFLTPDEAVHKYGGRLFLSRKELLKYRATQPTRDPSKQMLVVTLSHVKRYRNGILYPGRMTMAGEFLGPEEYSSLMSRL
jgi:hypothetical protein